MKFICQESLLLDFYSVARMGCVRLSDGGGPFGFDIHCAMEVDWIVQAFDCDVLVETGCHMGDTTDFLARRYQNKRVITCDIEPAYAEFTSHRLKDLPNVEVHCLDSEQLLKQLGGKFERSFYFLDAHWEDRWPIEDELGSLQNCVACVHDFNINHSRFDFDSHKGTNLDVGLIHRSLGKDTRVYRNNPDADYQFPCLQIGRRSGRGYLQIGLDDAILDKCPYLTQ